MNITKKYMDELSYNVIGAAIEVHKCLGPGLLESVYQCCLKHELKIRKIPFRSEARVPVVFKELRMDIDLRCDLLIENCLVIELKSVSAVLPVHKAKLISYMKLLNSPKGVLINFNCTNIFKEGQQTYVNELYRALPDE